MNIAITEILAIIGGVLVCGGFWTFIQFLINRYDGRKKAMKELQEAINKLQNGVDDNSKNMKLQNEALMSMAQDRVVWLGEHYLKRGYISLNDHASLVRMSDAYRALGGNGLVKEIMDEVDNLPRNKKEVINENK